MNGQQLAPMTVGFAIAVVLILVIGFFRRKRNMIAHLASVKRELKKEKQWLRRGEYNAAMVKGRQNLELFLKLVAEFNGIELDNSAQAMANARSSSDGRGQRETYRMNGRKRQRVMTFQQFGWWLDENGYLDRVGKWELNEIRVIGNKAVHENYVSKEDAWNQYNYMEDLLRIVKEAENDLHTEDRGSAAAKLQKEIEKNRAGQYCSNMILNVLLEEYEIRCQKVKIRLSVDAHVGELPGISRIHQCSILSNLMNNAMEAVEYLPESERWIRADIHVKADYLVIAVENPFAEKYLGMEKGGGRGYGSRILREIAKMYGGNCNVKIDSEKKIYKSTVILDAAGTGAEEERGRTA